MKKYALVLSVFTIISFGLLGFNINSASAQSSIWGGGSTSVSSTSSSLPSGCTSTAGYSSTTGVKCDTVVNASLPGGCVSTQGFSPLTGVNCSSSVNSSLPAGCTSTAGFSPTTGNRCSGSVQIYPDGCASFSGFSSTTGRSCGDSVVTSVISPSITSLGTNNALPGEKVALYLSGIPSARSYFVLLSGQVVGDVDASLSSNGTYLSFMAPNFSSGTYQLTAGGRNRNGSLAFKTQNSVPFTIGTSSTQSSVTVLSPNGGERYVVGQPITVTFNPSGAYGKYVEIDLIDWSSEKNEWTLGSVTGQATDKQAFATTIPSSVPGGAYKIRVCVGTENGGCNSQDVSDSNFTITSSSTLPRSCILNSGYSATTGEFCGNALPQMTITSPESGTNWAVGTRQSIRWTNQAGQDPHSPRLIMVLSKLDNTGKVSITESFDGYFPYLGSYPIGNDFGGLTVNVPNIRSGTYKVFLVAADSTPNTLEDNAVMSQSVNVTISDSSVVSPSGPTITSFDVSHTSIIEGGMIAWSGRARKGSVGIKQYRAYVVGSNNGTGSAWTSANGESSVSFDSKITAAIDNSRSFFAGYGNYTLRFEVEDLNGNKATSDKTITITPQATAPVIASCGGIQPPTNSYTSKGPTSYVVGDRSVTEWTYGFVPGSTSSCRFICENGGTLSGNSCVAPAAVINPPVINYFVVSPTTLSRGQTMSWTGVATKGSAPITRYRAGIVGSRGGEGPKWTTASNGDSVSFNASDISTAENSNSFFAGTNTYTIRFEAEDANGKSAKYDWTVTVNP